MWVLDTSAPGFQEEVDRQLAILREAPEQKEIMDWFEATADLDLPPYDGGDEDKQEPIRVKRGDIVLVALPGAYGKPRPVVVIQSDRLMETGSILVCPFTSELEEAMDLRLNIEPEIGTGLQDRWQITPERTLAVPRRKCSAPIGRLSDAMMAQLNARLALLIGIVD
jgi:mRNA interferase MazF